MRIKLVKLSKLGILFLSFSFLNTSVTEGQHSVARVWNEALLDAIRNDFARPTVHARNLFHTSAAMFDAWAVYEPTATPYLLGKTIGGFSCAFQEIDLPSEVKSAQEEAMSYAAYRLLSHRFLNSPSAEETLQSFDDIMDNFGYDKSFESPEYLGGSPAALGNYIAQCMIDFGLQDGSNEAHDYVNVFYQPVNEPLAPEISGNDQLTDPNRWQPLALEVFIGQSGMELGETPEFLSPEWGAVQPFSLSSNDLTKYERDGDEYWVYKDPGTPPYMDLTGEGDTEELYKWNFSLVSKWSSHLDPTDGVMWDISPASIGNIQEFPSSMEDFDQFYDEINGGDSGNGYGTEPNPITNEPYAAQMVPRGDYARVLAEFWADGPDSETPPGHWFTLLNYVSDHDQVTKKFKGEGDILDDLEWDIKSYFTLGGAMHDAAISAWGLKGWYDYLRPISAIRFIAGKGQSSDQNDLSYDPDGIPLSTGLIELVRDGDALEGVNKENVGKIKLLAWKGPDYIENPETDEAGVDWILAENWWPYQRPTFVTPPFAGYVSGHSTYSRAAAEVLTMLTGDAYFPGGMGEFLAAKNEFLVFEQGPSVDVVLQWATYRDASDQCSLSRIWGGIHPPADDIPGRIIGEEIGIEAFELAETYFDEPIPTSIDDENDLAAQLITAPNPINRGQDLFLTNVKLSGELRVVLTDVNGKKHFESIRNNTGSVMSIPLSDINLKQGIYFLSVQSAEGSTSHKISVQ